jgi:hypothetical protein
MMKLIHEFDSSSWRTMHRLVHEADDGTRIEGCFSLYDDVASLSDVEIAGQKLEGEPTSGYLAFSDFYKGVLPALVRFEKPGITAEEREIKGSFGAALGGPGDEDEHDDDDGEYDATDVKSTSSNVIKLRPGTIDGEEDADEAAADESFSLAP